MTASTAALGAGLRALLSRRIGALGDRRRWARSAADLQNAQLRANLREAAATEYGRGHAFARLAGLPDAELARAYRQAVPVNTYDDLLPHLRRMREDAAPDVLWPGVVRDWAQTSGTTAGDKYVPVSAALLAHNRKASLDVFCHAARFGVSLPRVFGGKILFLGGSTALATNDRGVRTGDLSGVVTPLIRWPVTSVILPGRDVALMARWPEKIDAMARVCVGQDVRWIAGMPSWTLVLAERVLAVARERGRSGVRRLSDVWPNLQAFVHGGVKYAPFDPRVREIWSGDARGPDVPTRLEVYPASEGFIAVQDTRDDPGLRLNIDHRIYYEFVPLEEIAGEAPRAFPCDRVEKGQRYVVVMSTCAGLWRYVIGDVVEFDTIPPDGPPRLRIVGRHRHFINAFGENLIVEHIENAVVAARRETGASVGEFTAAPVYPSSDGARRAGLELAIEWMSDAGAVRQFTRAFDEALKQQNVDYTTKRGDDLGMAPPTVTPLPPGAFHRWMESRGKLGGQHKCPRCANHREIIDGVMAAAGPADPVTVAGGRASEQGVPR